MTKFEPNKMKSYRELSNERIAQISAQVRDRERFTPWSISNFAPILECLKRGNHDFISSTGMKFIVRYYNDNGELHAEYKPETGPLIPYGRLNVTTFIEEFATISDELGV